MAQYRNVLSWLETRYLEPAMEITKTVVDSSLPDNENYPELKELEDILEEALDYVKRHRQ